MQWACGAMASFCVQWEGTQLLGSLDVQTVVVARRSGVPGTQRREEARQSFHRPGMRSDTMIDRIPIYQGRFIDRCPSMRSAGKLIPIGESAASCLAEIYPRPLTPPVVQKFLNTRRPNPGARTVFYGTANDFSVAEYITHGVNSRRSLSAGSLINAPLKTFFQQKVNEKKESLYSSHQRAPLGKTYDQTGAFPVGMDLNAITFGNKITRGLSAGSIINPPKSFKDVDEESRKGHQLYVVTHNDYNAGEKRDRKYDWTNYNENKRFGIETPHFNDGRNVSRSVRWLQEIKMKNGPKIVPKRVDDFRERSQPQLGKVHDPIADTLNVPTDHTFGLRLHPEKYGVGDVLHHTAPKNFLHGKDRHRAVLAAVQQHLKKANYYHFGSLLEAFRHYDKNGDGKIDKEELKKTCVQFGLDLESDLLDALLEYCDVDEDGLINFIEFANFLNWKDKMTIGKLEEKILTQGKKNVDETQDLSLKEKVVQTSGPPEGLLKPEDLTLKEEGGCEKTPITLSKSVNQVLDMYRTSSSQVNAVVGGPSSAYYRTFGIPTIRTDIAPPRIRRISDRNNYGDEANAFGLLCPSIFTQNSVYDRDVLKSRPKEEIAQVLRNSGVNISDQNFEELWKLAAKRHPKGEVSFETMRGVLDEMEAYR
ncbi:hypothetical protein FKM82_006809 [Ascaphus truei]